MARRSGDYGGLGAIIDQAVAERRSEATAPPVACPNHGDPLDRGPDGTLNCPLGDYTWGVPQRRTPLHLR